MVILLRLALGGQMKVWRGLPRAARLLEEVETKWDEARALMECVAKQLPI